MTPLDRSSSAASSPLASRDVNTSAPSPSKPTATDKELVKPKTMEYHRQVLQSRLEDDKCVPFLFFLSLVILFPILDRWIGEFEKECHADFKEQGEASVHLALGYDLEPRDAEAVGAEGEEVREVSF